MCVVILLNVSAYYYICVLCILVLTTITRSGHEQPEVRKEGGFTLECGLAEKIGGVGGGSRSGGGGGGGGKEEHRVGVLDLQVAYY